MLYFVPLACLTFGVFAALYLATADTADPLRAMLFLAALAALMVPLAAGCRWLAVVRQSLARAEEAVAASRSAYREAAEYLLAEKTPPIAPRNEAPQGPGRLEPDFADQDDGGSSLEGFLDELPAVTAGMIDALLHRDYLVLAGRAEDLRVQGERLGCRPLIDAATAVADGATAGDGQTATLAMMILVSTCQTLTRDPAVTA